MAKFSGKVGFFETAEESPDSGVYKEKVIERSYYGDIVRSTKRFDNLGNSVNPNLSVNVQISIVADPYARTNFMYIRYAEYMGVRWTVISADPEYPRILLTLGGVYNGERSSS